MVKEELSKGFKVNILTAPKIVKGLKSLLDKEKESQIKRTEPPNRVKVFNNIMEVLQWSTATPFQCNSGNKYTCYYCKEQCVEPADLKKHTLDSHQVKKNAELLKTGDMSRFHLKVDITDLRCKICSTNHENLDEIMHHLQKEHQKRVYMDVKDFIVPFKFDSDTLRCFICLNTFRRFKGLLEHMNTHCRNYVCKVCDAGFITRTGLGYHSKGHQTGTYACKFCEKVFTTLPRQQSHEKYVHRGLQLNKCSHCTESFRDYTKKLKHLLEVHGIAQAALKCHACDRTFSNQKLYRNHTKRDHLMERRYSCSVCERNFYTANELREHMITHTGDRKFQCDVCLKSYGRKTTLREHMRIHADDRRFKCEHCGMAFVQRCSWRGHMRAKHGEQV